MGPVDDDTANHTYQTNDNVARTSPSKPTAGPIRPAIWLPLTRPAGTAHRVRGHKAGRPGE